MSFKQGQYFHLYDLDLNFSHICFCICVTLTFHHYSPYMCDLDLNLGYNCPYTCSSLARTLVILVTVCQLSFLAVLFRDSEYTFFKTAARQVVTDKQEASAEAVWE